DHGAQVINLSLEFDMTVNSGDIPDILSAIRYAHRHGALVVAASGNEGVEQIAYPARAPDVVAVGATPKDRCLADYSNGGSRLEQTAVTLGGSKPNHDYGNGLVDAGAATSPLVEARRH